MNVLLMLLGVVVAVVLLARLLRAPKDPDYGVHDEPSNAGSDLSPSPPTPPQQNPPSQANSSALQPYSPIPLTVEGVAPSAVAQLRSILEDEQTYGRQRQQRILDWLLTTNGRIREVDEFIQEWGPRFAGVATEICVADPDWATSGELDRDDIRESAGKRALEGLSIRVADLDYEVIATPPSMDASADDALLERYGFETLAFYFRHASELDRVQIAPSDDQWYRPRFEDLVEKGLARRGTDIPPAAVLQTLTLKQMEAVAEGVEHKRFTRRAAAIEFLISLPDLRERLGRHVSLRELFQPLPLPQDYTGLDLVALGHTWTYMSEYAKLIDLTFSTAAYAHREASNATLDEYPRGWVVEPSFGGTPCCPTCAKAAGTFRTKGKAPRLPHHVGCTCQLSQLYE